MATPCSLCSGPMTSSVGAATTNRLPWHAEVRAIRASTAQLVARLTGVGLTTNGNNLLACNDSTLDYYVAPHLCIWLTSRDERHYGYMFHEVCWQLLLEQVNEFSSQTFKAQTVAGHLFNFYRSLPRWSYSWARRSGHDFVGLPLSFHLTPSAECAFLWAYPSLDDIALEQPDSQLAFRSVWSPVDTTAEVTAGNLFTDLPEEVQMAVIIELDSEDVCNIRLTCKRWAQIAHPIHLPQSFWASRFAADKEMSFYSMYVPQDPRRNWRDLYFQLRQALHDSSDTGYFRNRQRIWRRLRRTTRCLLPLLEAQADSTNWTKEAAWAPQNQAEKGEVVTVCPQPDELSIQVKYPRKYAGKFNPQPVFLTRNDETVISVGELSFSFVDMDGMPHLCGVKVWSRDGELISRSGVHMPGSSSIIDLNKSKSCTQIEFACSEYGMVGMKFELQNEDGHLASKTVGRLYNDADGIGLTTLRPREGYHLSGILFKFDVCRYVSAQLLEMRIAKHELSPADDTSLKPKSIATQANIIWHPEEPSLDSTHLLPQGAQSNIEGVRRNYVVNMNFGGSDGLRLSRLIRIVALHNPNFESLRGFRFFYNDGSQLSYPVDSAEKAELEHDFSLSTCVEQPVSIDGPGGERVVTVIGHNFNPLIFEDESSRLRGIKMYTNRGRLLDFQSNGWRYDKIQSVVFGIPECTESFDGPVLVSTPPQGYTINTILVSIETATDSIHSVGCSYIPSVDTNVNFQSPTIDLISESLEQDLSLDKKYWVLSRRHGKIDGIYSSFVDLTNSNIRRIRVSKKSPDVYQTVSSISGLLIEFWDSNPSVYLGQWFEETASLELEPGTKVTGCEFWEMQDSRTELVTAIKINLNTMPWAWEFELDQKSGKLHYSISKNYYEDLHCLFWTYNHVFNVVGITTKPSSHSSKTELMLDDMAGRAVASSRFPLKLLWHIEDDTSNILRVSCIHAVFDGRELTGFILEYGDTAQRSAGVVTGKRITHLLRDGEFVARLRTTTASFDEIGLDCRTTCVQVLTNKGRQLEFSAPELVSSADVPELGASDHGPSGQQRKPKQPKQKYPPLPTLPGCRSVGMWITREGHPKPRDQIAGLGIIYAYEPKPAGLQAQ